METKTIEYDHLPIFLKGNKKGEVWMEHGHMEVNPFCTTTFTPYNKKIIEAIQTPRFEGDFWEKHQTLKNHLISTFYISETQKGGIITCCINYFKPKEYLIIPPEKSGIKKIIHAKSDINKGRNKAIIELSKKNILKRLTEPCLETHLKETESEKLLETSPEKAQKIFERLYDNIPWNKYDFWSA